MDSVTSTSTSTIKIDGVTTPFTVLTYDPNSVSVNKPCITELRDSNGNVVIAEVWSAEVSYIVHKKGEASKRAVSLLSFVSGCNRVIFTKPGLNHQGLPPMGIMYGILPPETPEGEIAFQALLTQHILAKKAASAAERQAKREQEADALSDLFQQVVITETSNGSTEVDAKRLAAAAMIEEKNALKASKRAAAEACKAPPRVIAFARRSKNVPASTPPMELDM